MAEHLVPAGLAGLAAREAAALPGPPVGAEAVGYVIASSAETVATVLELLTRDDHRSLCGCGHRPAACVAGHAPQTLGDHHAHPLTRLAAAGLLRTLRPATR